MSLTIKSSSFGKIAGPLFLVLFIDGMGLGLIVPVLNTLLDPQSHFLASEFAVKFHNFIFGSVIGVFMLCWFLGAAILGDLSDQIGRKKSLLICLVGTFLGYLLAAAAVIVHSFPLLILGRIIAGLTSGSQPIAQAAIVDLSTTENKTRNIGYILLSLSLGFIVGPLLAGILIDQQLVSWFSLSTPFYFAAMLSLINAVLLQVLFKETFTQTVKVTIQFRRAWEIFASAFKHEKISYLSLIFLVFILGWSSFYSFITVYLVDYYNFTPTHISLFMAVMGLGFSIGNGLLVKYFGNKFTTSQIVIAAVLIGAACTAIMVYSHHAIYSWILIAPLACTVALAYSNLLALFSNTVSANAQGWVMGVTGAIMALVWGIVAILIGLLATWSVQLPLLLAAVSFVAVSLLMLCTRKFAY